MPRPARRPAGASALLTASSTRLAAWAVPAMSVSGRTASSDGGRCASTPGVSTSRSVPAMAAAIIFRVSSSASGLL